MYNNENNSFGRKTYYLFIFVDEISSISFGGVKITGR